MDNSNIIKKIINGSSSKKITFKELEYHGTAKEIMSWFTEMKSCKNSV